MRWLIGPAVLAILCALLGLGYFWFGVMRWDSTLGQVCFGAVGVAFGGACSALLPRLYGPRRKTVSRVDRKHMEKDRETAAREWRERKAGRIAELRANPARAKYAEMAEKGDLITDFEIAYLENPEMSLACVHFQHLERAMREAGVRIRPKMTYEGAYAKILDCGVAINYERLKAEFALPAGHVYEDFEDNHGGDGAYLRCRQCGFSFNTDYLRANSVRVFP